MYDWLSIDIASSAMSAERRRMAAIASNLANANTTRTPEGGAYKPLEVVFRAKTPTKFQAMLETQLGTSIGREYSRMDQAVFEKHLRGVEAEVIEVDRQPLLRHDPSHPDADPQTGFVAFPDISPVEQMTNMIAAARMYDANAALSRSTKSMIEDAIQALSS